MSQHRRTLTRPAGASVTRRRRLLVGAIGAFGASGLNLGGVGVPVSAGDVKVAGDLHASVEVQDGGCVTAAAGTGGADGSVVPEQGTDATGLEATGHGSATASLCRDDVDDLPPADPGGSLNEDLEGIVSGALDDVESIDVGDVMPGEPGGSLEGEVVAVVTAALDSAGGEDGDLPGVLDDIVPGDGGGSFPGEPGDPGLGGLVPEVSGIDLGDLCDRVGQILPGANGGGPDGDNGGSGPGGNGGGAPAINTSTNGSGSAAVGGAGAERGEPTDVGLTTEVGAGAPALVGTSASPVGTLPRTGGGLGNGVLRLIALLGLGRGLAGLAKRR